MLWLQARSVVREMQQQLGSSAVDTRVGLSEMANEVDEVEALLQVRSS